MHEKQTQKKVLNISAKHMINQILTVEKIDSNNRRGVGRPDRRDGTDRRDRGRAERPAENTSVITQALESEIWEREILHEQLNIVEAQEKEARHTAFHDSLTGLPNRALFKDRLKIGLELAKRHCWTLAVMFLDIDAFKAINDNYGHDVGDSVLCTISERLKANTRSDDTVCRYGGDEFLFLLMEVKNKQAVEKIAQSLLKIIQQPCVVKKCDSVMQLKINSSIGISMYPQDAETVDDLINSADKAMYKSKLNKSGYSFV